jgi:molecular chaperone GrpE
VTEREPEEQEGPIIRDRRRLDPETGAVREPATPAGAVADDGPPALADATDEGGLEATLAERTADLQRLQADYTNYRRRVERDREAVRELALVNILTNLLPVLDDIGRAREHGELEGGFKSVADALEAAVGKLGLERFGEPGEPFDPSVHEALTHAHSAEVTEPTAVQVFQPGYRIGARVVRPARVGVADPEPSSEG